MIQFGSKATLLCIFNLEAEINQSKVIEFVFTLTLSYNVIEYIVWALFWSYSKVQKVGLLKQK